jgi:hypothetical protein
VAEPGHQPQVLLAGENVVDRGERPGQTDQGSDGGRLADDVVSADPRSPTVWLEQRGQNVNRRGLSGAVGPEQREDATRGDVEVDAVQHDPVAEALGERVGLDG